MLGYIQAIVYVLMLSISTVWLSHLGNSLSIPTLLFGASLTAGLFFNLVRFKELYSNHMKILTCPRLWVLMSLAVMINWWLTYIGTIHGSASLLIALCFVSNGACGALVGQKYWHLIICIIVIAFVAYAAPHANFISISAGIGNGIAAFAYWKLSYQFANKTKIQANDILAIRFYPLIIISFMYLLTTHSFTVGYLYSWKLWFILVLFGLLNLVIPNYFSQSSVHHLGAVKFSQIVSIAPITTFMFQGIFLHNWSEKMLIACIIVFLVLNYSRIIDPGYALDSPDHNM